MVQDEDRLETANIDWMHKYKGSSKLLLLPRNTEEVRFLFIYLLNSLLYNELMQFYYYLFGFVCALGF